MMNESDIQDWQEELFSSIKSVSNDIQDYLVEHHLKGTLRCTAWHNQQGFILAACSYYPNDLLEDNPLEAIFSLVVSGGNEKLKAELLKSTGEVITEFDSVDIPIAEMNQLQKRIHEECSLLKPGLVRAMTQTISGI
jgi:hypothetical protein